MTAGARNTARRHPVHGVNLGILMLDTGFQRFPGDIGHAGTWRFPVLYKVVKAATQERMFSQGPAALVDSFVEGAEELAAMGVKGLATTCGFLAAIHPELSARCPVPVATSSLMQIPMAKALLPPGRTVGVLTADAGALGPEHFAGVGAPVDCPVAGMPDDGAFRRDLRGNTPVIDQAMHEAEALAAVAGLLEKRPDVRTIVSECTNLAPFSSIIARRFDLPVFDVVTLVEWFHASLAPRTH